MKRKIALCLVMLLCAGSAVLRIERVKQSLLEEFGLPVAIPGGAPISVMRYRELLGAYEAAQRDHLEWQRRACERMTPSVYDAFLTYVAEKTLQEGLPPSSEAFRKLWSACPSPLASLNPWFDDDLDHTINRTMVMRSLLLEDRSKSHSSRVAHALSHMKIQWWAGYKCRRRGSDLCSFTVPSAIWMNDPDLVLRVWLGSAVLTEPDFHPTTPEPVITPAPPLYHARLERFFSWYHDIFWGWISSLALCIGILGRSELQSVWRLFHRVPDFLRRMMPEKPFDDTRQSPFRRPSSR